MRAHIKKNIIALLAIMVALCLLGCGKATEPGSDFVYPLAVGNEWQYNFTTEVSNIRGDSAAVMSLFTSFMAGQSILTINDTVTVDDSIPTFTMQSYLVYTDAAFVDSGKTNLNNTPGGLYIFASERRTGMSLHKPGATGLTLRQGDKYFSSPQELFAYWAGDIISPPAIPDKSATNTSDAYQYYLTLAYPLAVSKTWIAIEEVFGRITHKSIVDFKDITVPAGDFHAYTIRTDWEDLLPMTGSPNPIRYDYVSAEGLIKREIFNYDIHVLDETATELAVIDFTTTYVLRSVELK